MIIAFLPTSGIQNPGQFPGFYQISLDKSIQSIYVVHVYGI